jgi:5-methylcytosine-specific restriction enzyme subunit McrC
MRFSNKSYTITEYGGFTRGVSLSGYQSLPEKTFDALESFILANTSNAETEAVKLLPRRKTRHQESALS